MNGSAEPLHRPRKRRWRISRPKVAAKSSRSAISSTFSPRRRVPPSGRRFSSTTTRSRVFDYAGDIGAFGAGEQGLYHEGTRYLSRFTLRVNGKRPLLLSSRVKEDNELFGADLTNPDIPIGQTGDA